MLDRFTTSQEPVLQFGAFSLVCSRRVLLRNGVPVRMGSRAREVLYVLTENPGQLVSKSQIISRVWPHCVVEDGTLRVHIAALRKVLGVTWEGYPYIENVTGHGYRFVIPTTHMVTPVMGVTTRPQGVQHQQNIAE
jgi:DNA-binding winged helix-turn-helix (wHTH) protein